MGAMAFLQLMVSIPTVAPFLAFCVCWLLNVATHTFQVVCGRRCSLTAPRSALWRQRSFHRRQLHLHASTKAQRRSLGAATVAQPWWMRLYREAFPVPGRPRSRSW